MRLLTRRHIEQAFGCTFEAPAATNGEKSHEIAKVEAQTAQEDRLTRSDGGEVDICWVLGLKMTQTVRFRVIGQLLQLRIDLKWHMSLSEDDRVQFAQSLTIGELERLMSGARVVEADRAGSVNLHIHASGGILDGLVEDPL